MARKIPLIPPVLSMNYMAQQFGNMMRGHFFFLSWKQASSRFRPKYKLLICPDTSIPAYPPHILSSYGVRCPLFRQPPIHQSKTYEAYTASHLRNLILPPGRNVVRYSMIAEDIVSYLKEIEEELQSRYELLAKGIESDPAEADYMLLIIDNPDAIEQISNSKEALASYKNIIGRYRNMNVGVIISAIENAPIPYSAPEVIKGIRDGRHLMYFGDISELKIYDMPLAVTRKFKKPIETGDGYYIKENECIKLKTPFIAGE